MKLIIAYIQPERLNDVKQSLYEKEVYKISVTNALGCGQQKGYHESYRGVDIEVNLLKKVRLEIAVNEDFVKPTVDAIIKGARTGNIGGRQNICSRPSPMYQNTNRGNRQRCDRIKKQFNIQNLKFKERYKVKGKKVQGIPGANGVRQKIYAV